MTPDSLPPDRVRAAIDAVFRDPAYHRSLQRTLWDELTEAAGRALAWLRQLSGESPALYWTLVGVAGVAAAALVARAAYLAHARGGDEGRRRAARGARAAGRDAWALAQQEAAAGNHTAAAHALYQALLDAVARQERLAVHPSKTVGDYARELRHRSSALFGRFRDFARAYEVVVYGHGRCDAERYERLRALALPIVRPAGGDA